MYKPTGNCWTDDRELPYRDLNSIHLRNGQKENLIMDLKTFKSRANWYKSRGIPYRRGYLLYGPPGTGKSSTIQAVAVSNENHSQIRNYSDSYMYIRLSLIIILLLLVLLLLLVTKHFVNLFVVCHLIPSLLLRMLTTCSSLLVLPRSIQK